MKSIGWVFEGCDPKLQAEIVSGKYDTEFPRLRLAFIHWSAEVCLAGALQGVKLHTA